MRSRFGIATQALGVAALGALVYFAFLQPSDPDPLSGIEVDGDLPSQVTAGNGHAEGRDRNAGARNGAAGRSRVPRIRLVPVVPGATPSLPGSEPSVPPTLAGNDTPTGSQYESAVARVLGRVAREQR